MVSKIYILKLNNGQYYIGATNNLARRMLEHQSGHTKSIKYKLPCKLVFHKECKTYKESRKIETFIKRQKSKIFIEKIISQEVSLDNNLVGP